MHRFVRDPASEGQSRLDGDAIESDGQIGPGETVPVHIARDRGLSSKRVIDLLPVDFLSVRDRGEGGRNDRSHEPKFDAHLVILLVWTGVGRRRFRRQNVCPYSHRAQCNGEAFADLLRMARGRIAVSPWEFRSLPK
jgi:hypothetical protein